MHTATDDKPIIIFFGTPHFATTIVNALYAADYPIAAVVTQPDKAVGRKQVLTPPPVKVWAQERAIPYFQPKHLSDSELARLKTFGATLFVVAAYGLIFPTAFLTAPRYGSINVHASLLPKYRGPSPVSAAIKMGEKETGTTIMYMDPRLDTGPILAQATLPIAPTDTRATLSEKLATTGATLLVTTLPKYLAGKISMWTQDETKATQTHLLDRDDGQIDWERSAAEIERHVRAMSPWPGAWTTLDDKPLKIHRVRVLNATIACAVNVHPGQTFVTEQGELAVSCRTGSIIIEQAQRAGKKTMATKDILRGNSALGNTIFTKK